MKCDDVLGAAVEPSPQKITRISIAFGAVACDDEEDDTIIDSVKCRMKLLLGVLKIMILMILMRMRMIMIFHYIVTKAEIKG